MTTISATSATVATPSVATSSTTLASDFETFLKMLTAQARYQDPLEPLDSSEFSSQLAQFSMVEQQVLSNDLLASLAGQIGSGNMAQMAGWIGMEARTTAPVQFDGSPITIHPNPIGDADTVFLSVYDGRGQEVQRSEIPVSADPILWAGVSEDGTPFPAGAYSFQIESYKNDELALGEPAETYALINEARVQDGQTVLIVAGGSMILADSVTGLRNPN